MSARRSATVSRFTASHAQARACAVVEDALPEGEQRLRQRGVAAVGAAHLDDPLHPHLGEDRGEVILPVEQRGALALEPLGEEGAERAAAGVEVRAAAAEEDHRDVERPLDVAPVGVGLEPGSNANGRSPERAGSVSSQTAMR